MSPHRHLYALLLVLALPILSLTVDKLPQALEQPTVVIVQRKDYSI